MNFLQFWLLWSVGWFVIVCIAVSLILRGSEDEEDSKTSSKK